MSSVVTIVGPLGTAPEIKINKNGGEYMNLSVGSRFTRVIGKGKSEVQIQWNKVVVTVPALVKAYKDFLSPGTTVMVVGQLQNSHQTATVNGNERTIKRTVIVVGPHDRFSIVPGTRRKEPISKEDVADSKDNVVVQMPAEEPTNAQIKALKK